MVILEEKKSNHLIQQLVITNLTKENHDKTVTKELNLFLHPCYDDLQTIFLLLKSVFSSLALLIQKTNMKTDYLSVNLSIAFLQ